MTPAQIDSAQIDPVQTDPAQIDSAQIDPRGAQFNATLTSVLLAVVLLTAPGAWGSALLAVQLVLFGLGVALGVQHTPAAYLFKHLVRPRLRAPSHLEDARPPRFAQAVGLAFAVVGLAGFLSGATLLGMVATGLALVAALLNAVFGFCLGCELYLLVRRVVPAQRNRATSALVVAATTNLTTSTKAGITA